MKIEYKREEKKARGEERERRRKREEKKERGEE
jgi:hypothetical protein